MVTVESVENPVYTNETGTQITANIKFEEFNEVLPFTADVNDTEAHGRQIYADLVAGKYGAIGEYVPPPTAETAIQPTTTGTQTA